MLQVTGNEVVIENGESRLRNTYEGTKAERLAMDTSILNNYDRFIEVDTSSLKWYSKTESKWYPED